MTPHRARPDNIGLTVAALDRCRRARRDRRASDQSKLRQCRAALSSHRRYADAIGGLSDAVSDDTAEESEQLVERTVTINRPRHELYAFWRDFSNLAQIMENIESVTVLDERRSHWVVRAPAGQTVEWDSVIVEDIPDELISWQSDAGADVTHSGRIDFRDAPGGRGTW